MSGVWIWPMGCEKNWHLQCSCHVLSFPHPLSTSWSEVRWWQYKWRQLLKDDWATTRKEPGSSAIPALAYLQSDHSTERDELLSYLSNCYLDISVNIIWTITPYHLRNIPALSFSIPTPCSCPSQNLKFTIEICLFADGLSFPLDLKIIRII